MLIYGVAAAAAIFLGVNLHHAASQRAALPNSHADSRIVVSLSERKLAVIKGGRVAGEYPVAIGKPDTPTPAGEFHVNDMQSHPGPAAGVFGARWIEFNRRIAPDGVTHLDGIHGTNAPQLIGAAVSHGCIRMSNHDVEEVFRDAFVGEPVEIVDGPIDDGAR
ncbi:MAG TPA: L,D-transpeptidase [Candidatus Solibacter sp.]|nr:L,D-transpeptidase [Candidatus Solibacter sp.]